RAGEQQVLDLLRRKTYWTAARHGSRARVWMVDPYDLLYCDATREQLLAAARKLEAEGLLELEGDYAEASGALLLQKDEMEAEMRAALRALEAKHAFERA